METSKNNAKDFSVPEMFANTKGQTASALLAAFLLVFFGLVMSFVSLFYVKDEYKHLGVNAGISFAGMGTAIYTARKISGDYAKGKEERTKQVKYEKRIPKDAP